MGLQRIAYECEDVTLTGYLALPEAEGQAPGVLVAHEATGVGDHVRSRALALAELGYVAFALDLYGIEGFPRDEQVARHTELMDRPGLFLSRAKAGLHVLAAQPSVDTNRMAAIGFCQGGATVLELARACEPIRCAIGFHPGYVRSAGSPDGPISAKILMMSGSDDPLATEDLLANFATEMTQKGADWQLHLFGGVGHTFTNPSIDALHLPGFAYDAAADRRSWAMMRLLLEECLSTD
jgi:dienelactone hydrolase